MSETKTENILEWLINYSSAPIMVLTGRGGGKSNLIGALAYSLTKRGWLSIILDPKAAFTYFKLPNIADPELAPLVKSFWGDFEIPKMEFYMPYYAWDWLSQEVPEYITPAPIAMSMVKNQRAWELLDGKEGELKSGDVDSLVSAFISTGKEDTTPSKMLNWLAENGKLSPRLSEVLFSGLISTESQIEPSRLLEPGPKRIIVMTSPLTNRPSVIAFWYGVFLDSLLGTLRSWPHPLNVAIFLDETLVLSHGSKETSSTWWFTLLMTILMSQGRQIGKFGDVRTRVIFSSQMASAVDFELASMSQVALVAPDILMTDGDRAFLRRHFSRKIGPPKGEPVRVPGAFYIFTKTKKLGYHQFPPSPLFIPKEYDEEDSEEMIERQRRFIQRNIRFKSLTPLYVEAKTRQAEFSGFAITPTPPPLVNWEKVSMTVIFALFVLARMHAAGELEEMQPISHSVLVDRFMRELEPHAPQRIFVLKTLSPGEIRRSVKRFLSFGIGVTPEAQLTPSKEFILRYANWLFNELTPDRVRQLILKKSRSKYIGPLLSETLEVTALD